MQGTECGFERRKLTESEKHLARVIVRGVGNAFLRVVPVDLQDVVLQMLLEVVDKSNELLSSNPTDKRVIAERVERVQAILDQEFVCIKR